MGLYATTTSISELLPNYLKSNTTTSDTYGTAVFSRHIDRAEGVVNSFLAARYALPFTTVPPIVRTLSEDLASWFAARGAYAQDSQLRQEYLDRFDDAVDMLREIRDGKLKVALTNGSLVSPQSTSRFLTSTDYSHVFNLDEPESWGVDADQIDDMENAR